MRLIKNVIFHVRYLEMLRQYFLSYLFVNELENVFLGLNTVHLDVTLSVTNEINIFNKRTDFVLLPVFVDVEWINYGC